ncbi:hypothetical protein ACM64Y_17905 [Novispirillum sp. DQ9]
MSRPLVLAVLAAAGIGLLGLAGWLWWRFGAAVFLGGGMGLC